MLTDSGGIQEETTALGVTCLTLRDNTERPITETEGTNTVVGTDPDAILKSAQEGAGGQGKSGRVPPLWDGATAGRIIDILARDLGKATLERTTRVDLAEPAGSSRAGPRRSRWARPHRAHDPQSTCRS